MTLPLPSMVDRWDNISFSHNPAAHYRCIVRSGNINIGIGRLRNVGRDGTRWVSHSYSNVYWAYAFGIGANSNTDPSGSAYRYQGYPLRCLSTVCRYKETKKRAWPRLCPTLMSLIIRHYS